MSASPIRPCVSTPQGIPEGMNATIRRAQLLAHEHGIEISPSRVSRIVRRHAATGTATAEHLVRCLRAYADPTGDAAVRNAMQKAPGSGCNRPEAKPHIN